MKVVKLRKKGPTIRKLSLRKVMFSTNSSITKCIWSKARAAHPVFFLLNGCWSTAAAWLHLDEPSNKKASQQLGQLRRTRRSENDNTPQPHDQWTNSPFIGQQVGNCRSFTLTHYLANLFAKHRGPRSIPLCIQHHIQLTTLSFKVSRPSHSELKQFQYFTLKI